MVNQMCAIAPGPSTSRTVNVAPGPTVRASLLAPVGSALEARCGTYVCWRVASICQSKPWASSGEAEEATRRKQQASRLIIVFTNLWDVPQRDVLAYAQERCSTSQGSRT